MGKQSSHSFTVGFIVSGPINRWINVGLETEASYSTGNSYECNGQPNQKVSIWSCKHHYAYSIKNIEYPMDPSCGKLRE
jgi:hypothetical protein